mmetsp:Transcript_39508/g.35291  ORF Transcript_39508/g.35291 Transcript_39508/m.35291 type:complete len:86 (+) Transcript_39508:906-1163(+)
MEEYQSPNGDCYFENYPYAQNYFTAVIRNQTAEYHDALFLNLSSANVFYNGSTYELPICSSPTWENRCTAYANFYYDNGTLAVVS